MDKSKPYTESGDEAGADETSDVEVRADTPGYMPQYLYSREKLMDLAETYVAKIRPKCLLKAFDNADGLWDPEKWSQSFGSGSVGLGSGETSPLTVGENRDRRRPELDREQMLRRRPSDPRSKEDRDGIMLCPQRRSFGTGCHVTQSPSVGRQTSCPADFKDSIDRDRDRRERRIGSGRIAIDRDQGREREYRNVRDRYERDDRRPRQERTFERSSSYHNSSYENRSNYRDSRFNRDSRDGRSGRRGRMNHDEEEPEWFSAGPTSQHDTIELRGFEKEQSPERVHDDEEIVEEEEEEEAHTADTDDKAGISVGDRNGSLETNESSSPEVNHETRPSPNATFFDINDMFKVSGLPMLDEHAVEQAVTSAGSRFTHFFMAQQQQQQMGQHHSKENSRRSSINDEFKYLEDIMEGSRSPLIPSPVHPGLYDKPENVYAQYAMNMNDKNPHLEALYRQKNSPTNPVLNALFMNSSGMEKSNTPVSSGNFSTQDAEAQLKAMLFRGRDSNSSSGTASPALMGGASRKVKTLAELEAAFHHESPTSHASPVQQVLIQPSQQQQQQHHHQQHQHQHVSHHVQQQHMQQQNADHYSHQGLDGRTPEDGDLTAFNKLLSMMQAGAAAAVEGHQQQHQINRQQQQQQQIVNQQMLMSGGEGRSMSPLQIQQQHNSHDFIQALMRNKEQQLQIQQQTLQQMQRHQIPPQQQQQQQQNIMPSQAQQLPQPMLPPQHAAHTPQTPRAITQDPVLNFLQHNPTIITKPPSPAPTIPKLMPTPSTPRVVSPSPQSLPTSLLPKQVQQPQQISGAKIPSPIMFSQQPPMHLSAPSPIHPTQLAHRSLASQPISSNTLTTASANIRPQNVARVPSPQELIAHTQAIMQSALIKKQLEDQKERFLKKQQERARSPNQNRTNASPQSTPVGPGQTKSAMSPAFTPTSVMRKMHSDRASEKEKGSKECDIIITDDTRPLETHGDKLDAAEQARQDAEEIASLPGIDFSAEPSPTMTSLEEKLKLAGISSQSNNKTAPILGLSEKSSRPLVGQGMMQSGIPLQLQSPANSTPMAAGRPIVKAPVAPAGTPGQFRPVTGPGAVSTPVRSDNQRPIVGSNNISQMDVVKVLEQQQQRLQQQQQETAAAAAARQAVNTHVATGRPVGVGSNPPFGMPITGRLPVQPAGIANALLMQQMMQQSNAAARAGLNLNQLNQLNQINQLAALQAQQRMVDPRLQGVRYPGIVPQMLNPRSTAAATTNIGLAPSPAINAVLGRALSPGIMPGQKLNVNGPLSPNMSCTSPAQLLCNPTPVNGNNNITKTPPGTDPNILKWFSSDVLKNHMPTMPPLPTQGQKVLTVDDLEGT